MNTDTENSIELSQVSSVSQRALSIAMAIDRLPVGYEYNLHIEKPEIRALEWRVEIVREERLQIMRLTYRPE